VRRASITGSLRSTPTPAQVDDATAAYRRLLGQGIAASHVAFTGDSSGGLTITAQLDAREEGLPLPAAAMPFSPWTDMEVVGEHYGSNWSKETFFLLRAGR
jgi:epsilon-lactone hydrolase